MDAKLVWDGSDCLYVPDEMGTPRDDQMSGSVAENLSELCGRVCYDSLGKGRSSEAYHDHLLQVGHWSVYEHFNLTFFMQLADSGVAHRWLPVFLNRRGVWVRLRPNNTIRFTLNLRSALEWDRFDEHEPERCQVLGALVGQILHDRAPTIFKTRPETPGVSFGIGDLTIVPPEDDHERWISLYLMGSRGFSHEIVRHGDETGISQRSTRYVNEGESPWVIHPLIQAFQKDAGPAKILVETEIQGVIEQSRAVYKSLVEKLETWLLDSGKLTGPYAKVTARKQARGAARGMLGNALQTELIFSASVAQWKHMLRMRAADAADAEIRTVFNAAVPALKSSAYGDRFADTELEPASDGLGMSLKGGGHK